MEDEPLDLSKNSASLTKETSTEKRNVAKNDMRVLPEQSSVTLEEFSSSGENIWRTSEQESKKSFYSPKEDKIKKPLESQYVITGSNLKTKRKMSEDPSKYSEAKRRRATYSASSRKTEDKQRLPGVSDYSNVTSADYIFSQPSTSSDGNSNYDSSVTQNLSSSCNCVSSFICKNLKRHFRTHTREKTFKCVQCEKAFNTKKCLARHTNRVHTNLERSYRCTKCEKSFAFKQDLTQHSERHREEKLFLCNECKKSFKGRRELIQHSKTHTRERPLPCKACGKSFATKDLTKHSRTHTGVKPYECLTCGKVYTSIQYLNSHEKTHK